MCLQSRWIIIIRNAQWPHLEISFFQTTFCNTISPRRSEGKPQSILIVDPDVIEPFLGLIATDSLQPIVSLRGVLTGNGVISLRI